jgi:pilus assembly protein CpaC
VTDEGKINLQISPEVSSADYAGGISTSQVNVPRFATRRMQTTLELMPDQALVLAGLFSQEDQESMSRLPGAGALPIIGPLFRNKWKDKRDNEMVVIIRPEIIDPSAAGTSPNPGLMGFHTP